MKQFYIKDLSRLKDFGFNYKNGYYFIITHRAPNVWIDENTQRMTIQSPSKDMIALICEMYKDGVVEIVDDQEPATFNMKVTEEEMKVIFDLRKGEVI